MSDYVIFWQFSPKGPTFFSQTSQIYVAQTSCRPNDCRPYFHVGHAAPGAAFQRGTLELISDAASRDSQSHVSTELAVSAATGHTHIIDRENENQRHEIRC